MQKLIGKVVLVTGASSGIGYDLCKSLVSHGLKVIGVARNVESIESLQKDIGSNLLTAISCDLTNTEEIESLFKNIKVLHGGVDICINNAGMSYRKALLEGTPSEWKTMMNLNVIALCHCSQLAIQSMQERNVDDGHIINVCSLAGHLLSTSKYIHFYTATKHAVRAITEGLRLEMRELNSHIRVTSISPGVVKTDFFRRAFNGDEEASEKLLSSFQPLTGEDIANSIIHILSAPSHVEINEIIIRPVEQSV